MSTHTTRLNPVFEGLRPAVSSQSDAAHPGLLRNAEPGWRHAFASCRGLLRKLLGSHRLHAGRARSYSAPVTIGNALRDRWQRVFDVPDTTTVPLLYSQGVGSLLYARVFDDLGINRKHLLHLKHLTVHVAGVPACAAAQRQQLVCSLKRALRMAHDKALVELHTQVLASDGSVQAVVEDSFLIRHLPAADLAALPGDRSVMRELVGLRGRRPQIDLGAPAACARWLPVPHDFGAAYAGVCGDVNPAHGARSGPRLFGSRRPFLQGMGVRNLVACQLADMGVPLDRFSLTFASPAYLGQTLSLVVHGERHELHDERGRLVAYGEASA